MNQLALALFNLAQLITVTKLHREIAPRLLDIDGWITENVLVESIVCRFFQPIVGNTVVRRY